VLVVLLGVFAAGCTGDTDRNSDSPGQSDSVPVPAAAGIDPDRQAPALPIEGAVEGGVVTASGQPTFDTLDPSGAYWVIELSIMSGLVTRSLTQYVYDADLDTMVLVPDIATDVGTPNADFTEWTYTIRPGVKFEDGTVVTAEDVAYGIKRSFDRTAFPTGPTYSNDYFLEGDTYPGLYQAGGGDEYDGVVVDGDTLTIRMDRPFPDMPYWGAFPAMGPIREDGSNPDDYARHPLATGPYKFDSYVPGESLTLVRNDQWDPNTDPGRHQYPDGYRFSFREPAGEIVPDILADAPAGRTAVRYDSVPPADARSALDNAPDLVTPSDQPCLYGLYLDMRTIKDIRVRQAVGYAYPYQDVLDAQPDLVVRPDFVRTLMPPGVAGRIDYNPLPTELGETDPAKAAALLDEAGYEPGEFTLKFPYADDPFGVARRDIQVAAFEAAGFDVVTYAVPGDVIGARQGDPNAPYNIRFGGWCSDWPTGGSWLPRPFSTSDPGYNWSHLDEKAVDDEMDRIRRLPLGEQPAAWGALDRSIETEYYPFVGTYQFANLVLHGSRIAGINGDLNFGLPTWKDVYVTR
jgi:peptide/nickel transport system substrate-binding protein